MLESSRETCSGIQLEVNEKILDSCNQLMKVAEFFVVLSAWFSCNSNQVIQAHTHFLTYTNTRLCDSFACKVCLHEHKFTYLLYCLQAIRLLVEKSKLLQKEIVAQGRVCDLLLLCSWHYKFSFYTRYYRDMYTFFRSLIRRLITGTTYLSSLCSLC